MAVLALGLQGGDARALTVHIAPLALLDSASAGKACPARPDKLILKELDAVPLSGSVEFRLADGGLPPPSSFFEAARLCEGLGYSYLLYGYMREGDGSYYSELKLLAREGKRIVASFIACDDAAHYERMIGDLGVKISDYFLKELALAPREKADDRPRIAFEPAFSLGYWTPVGEWAGGMMGVACADLGLRFFPSYALAAIKSKPLCIGAGLYAEYALGMNRPGFERSFLHRALIRLPLEACLGLGGGSRIGVALGPLVEFDVLAQDRKYGDAFVETRSAGGLSASLSYRYPISDRLALALECAFDAVLYSRPLYSIDPRLSFDYSIGKRN